jgi:hypothetical protein
MKIVVNQLTASEILPSQLRPRNIIAFEYDGRIYKLHYCESAYVFVSLDDSETKLGSRRNDTIVGIIKEIEKDYSVTILMFESRREFLEWALSR